MAMYRCAACGSSHVVVDTKKEGFSVSKAVAGTVLFGSVGAVMGVNGKEQLYYHCADCGQTLRYPMSDFIKTSIENHLDDSENNLFLLEQEKKKYPNIEWCANSTFVPQKDKQIVTKNENELADAVWEFYLKTQIPYISIRTIGKEVLRDDSAKICRVLEILENRGVLMIEKNGEAHYCIFCSNVDEIKNNLYAIQNRTENEKSAAVAVRLACRRELVDAKIIKKHPLLLTGVKYEILKAGVLGALKGDLRKTIGDLQVTSAICAEYSKQHLSVNLKQMVDEGLIERSIEKDKTYYSLIGATIRNKEKERQRILEEENKRIAEEKERQRLLEEAQKHNKKLNEQISILQKERNEQETIVSRNAMKFFGAGAQAKKAASKRIAEIDAEISDLRSCMK